MQSVTTQITKNIIQIIKKTVKAHNNLVLGVRTNQKQMFENILEVWDYVVESSQTSESGS